MAKLFVVQEYTMGYEENPGTWYVFNSAAKAKKKASELEDAYYKMQDDNDNVGFEINQYSASGTHCGLLIGFDDNAGEIFAEPVNDVRGYSLDSSSNADGNTTAVLIGPKSKEGTISITEAGDLDISGNIEELAVWMASDLIDDNIPAGVPGAEQGSGKPSKFIPDNADDVLNTVKVMKALWDSVKKENKNADAVKGLPTSYWDGGGRIHDFQYKWVWFINVLNGAIFKCTKNQIYSDLEYWKFYKENKNFFRHHDNFRPYDKGLYFEWPENITKDVNKIVAAAKKDQEICFKAAYLLNRDFLGVLPRKGGVPEEEMEARYTDARGNNDLVSIDLTGFNRVQQYWGRQIIGAIEDDKSVPEVGYWGDIKFTFENVQTTNELKYVQLFENFVNSINN